MSVDEQLVDSWLDDFSQAYDDDSRNAARQPFEEYWRWVKVFLLTGGAGQRGWLEQGEDVIRRVRDAAASDELRGRLRAVGKAIAAEWAKESRHRRIHSTLLQGSPNLFDWGRQLQRAAEQDTGDGTAIGRALDAIERDVRNALRR